MTNNQIIEFAKYIQSNNWKEDCIEDALLNWIKDNPFNHERYTETATHLILNHNHSLKKDKKKYTKIDMFRYAAYCIDTKGRIDLAERFKSWKKLMKQLKNGN